MTDKLASRLPKAGIAVLCALTLLLSFACDDSSTAPTQNTPKISVQLRNMDTYEHPTVGGDEEGARITKQAQHYRVSEIRRDESTNWVAVYVYQPRAGYVGTDYAELEIHTNTVGTPEHDKVTTLVFQFTITN